MMEIDAVDQMADSFDLSGMVSSLSDHDSTSPEVQPLVGMDPAVLLNDLDESDEMEVAGEDSGIGSSIGPVSPDVDNRGPSQMDAASDRQASGVARATTTIPADLFSTFTQDILASVPEGAAFVSEPRIVHEQSRPDVQPLVGVGPADLQNDLNEGGEMEAAGEDSGIGFSIGPVSPDVDNRGPSQMDAAGDRQASGVARATTIPPAEPVTYFAQDSPDSEEDVMVSESVGRQQFRSEVVRNSGPDAVVSESVHVGHQQSRSEGVRYGEEDDVEALAERLGQISHRTDVRGQEGILLEETRPLLSIVNRRYQKKSEYDIVMLLGKGSYGAVNLIRDRQSRRYAVKKCIPLKEFNPNEPINWCRLRHPVIVQFLGFMRTDTEVVYFSKYNTGYQTLQRREEQQRSIQIEPKLALLLTHRLFQALVHMHNKGIVHMDIHGSNILINESLDDISFNPLMIDFGESQKITDDQDRYDVWCLFHILIRFLGGHPSSLDYDKKGHQTVPVPANTDKRLRDFLQWGINKRPRAVEVLGWIESLQRELDSVSSSMIPVTGPPTGGYVPPEN